MTSRLKTTIGILAASVLGSAAALAAPMVSGDAPAADAAGICSPRIENAIKTATGVNTGQFTSAGLVCNPLVYGITNSSSEAQVNTAVSAVMNRCGNDQRSRFLVLALLELAGQPPAAPSPEDLICHEAIYEQWVDDHDTSPTTDKGVNWASYSSSVGANWSVFSAVNGMLSTCDRKLISFAVASVTDRYPNVDPSPASEPNLFYPNGTGGHGQCDPGLYNNGSWGSYAGLRGMVQDRASSTATCPSRPEIATAYRELTGWAPLSGECEPTLYGNGSWANHQELVNRIYHANRCFTAAFGQAYAFNLGAQSRRIHGLGRTGECLSTLYKNPGPFISYQDVISSIQSVHGVLVQQGVSIDGGGDLTVNGKEYDGSGVLTGSRTGAPQAAALDGKIYETSDRSNIKLRASDQSKLLGAATGNVIAPTGGKLISDNGLGLIGAAASNVVSAGGANIASTYGGG